MLVRRLGCWRGVHLGTLALMLAASPAVAADFGAYSGSYHCDYGRFAAGALNPTLQLDASTGWLVVSRSNGSEVAGFGSREYNTQDGSVRFYLQTRAQDIYVVVIARQLDVAGELELLVPDQIGGVGCQR